ncbi:MAG: copper oxidase, partial [Acidobacteriota bacterium]
MAGFFDRFIPWRGRGRRPQPPEAADPAAAGDPAAADARPGRRRFLAFSALAPLLAVAPALARTDPHAGHGGPAMPEGHGGMAMPEGHGGHGGHGGQIFPWRNPAIAITPPPPLTGKGDGVVMTPHVPSL